MYSLTGPRLRKMVLEKKKIVSYSILGEGMAKTARLPWAQGSHPTAKPHTPHPMGQDPGLVLAPGSSHRFRATPGHALLATGGLCIAAELITASITVKRCLKSSRAHTMTQREV